MDPRNLDQRARLRSAFWATQVQKFSQHPEWLEPGEGTIFYCPPHAPEQAVRRIERVVAEYIDTDPAPERTLFDLAGEAVAAKALHYLSLLEKLVEAGDPSAIHEFTTITHRIVETLNTHAKQQPGAFRAAAMKLPNWPVLKGKRPKSNKWTNIPVMMGVGNAIPFTDAMASLLEHRNSKRVMLMAVKLGQRIDDWRTRDRKNIYFMRRFQPATKAEENAKQLMPFSTETWRDWFELAWSILLEENRGHPELNPQLRPIGQARAMHSVQVGAQKVVTERTKESNIQSRIRERLAEAYKAIANSLRSELPKKRRK